MVRLQHRSSLNRPERTVTSDRQISHLVECLPEWILIERSGNTLFGAATIKRPNGGSWPAILLEISVSVGGKLQAREHPQKSWPKFCPQRHINLGGFFCLGLAEVPRVLDATAARRWWEILSEHLQLQFVADATRTWPKNREWDHGDAGITQQQMETLVADHPVLLADVRLAHLDGIGWLAGPLPRLSKDGKRLVNGRAPCPKGCLKRKHPILRRACPDRDIVFRLVAFERLKRKQSSEFWDAVKGQACCGSMTACPLQRGD